MNEAQVRTDAAIEGQPLSLVKIKPRGEFAKNLRRFRKHPSGMIGGVVLSLSVLLVLLASFIAPYSPLEQTPVDVRQSSSLHHLLGTDHLGRDILSRILYGGRTSLVLGLIAVGIGGVLGTFMGLLAGYFRGFLDTVLMLFNDILLTLPSFLLALGAVAILGTGIYNVMIAVGISLIPTFARVVRGSALTAREAVYVDAARVIGVGNFRIMLKHVLPNVLAPVIVLGTVGVATAVLTGASLSFVGVGAQPPSPEWGLMVNEGRRYLRVAWWISTWPGVAIMIVVIAINLVGDALRDVLDPRLRQR